MTIGPPVVASLRRASSAFLDVHLMVGHPETYVRPMGFAGAGSLAFHFEAARDIRALTDAIHDGGMRVANHEWINNMSGQPSCLNGTRESIWMDQLALESCVCKDSSEISCFRLRSQFIA